METHAFGFRLRGKAPEGQKRFPISTRFLKVSKPGLAGLILAVGLLLLFPVETAMAQATDDVEARNKATVQAGFDAWKNGTGSPYDALADNATWTIVGNSVVSRTYASREDFLSVVIRPFNARMSSRLIR